MTYDRKWLKEYRESVWNEDNMQNTIKDMFVSGNADFLVGCKAEEIPTLIDAFEKAGNSDLVKWLKELQDGGVGWDRQKVEKEEEE